MNTFRLEHSLAFWVRCGSKSPASMKPPPDDIDAETFAQESMKRRLRMLSEMAASRTIAVEAFKGTTVNNYYPFFGHHSDDEILVLHPGTRKEMTYNAFMLSVESDELRRKMTDFIRNLGTNIYQANKLRKQTRLGTTRDSDLFDASKTLKHTTDDSKSASTQPKPSEGRRKDAECKAPPKTNWGLVPAQLHDLDRSKAQSFNTVRA